MATMGCFDLNSTLYIPPPMDEQYPVPLSEQHLLHPIFNDLNGSKSQ